MLNIDTQVCISISNSPSNFGTTVHNAGYAALDLNYIYKACKIADLEGAICGVRALNIKGCSVSMPYKEDVIALLDRLDASANTVGAVNTIVNQENTLVGYNTDVIGAARALEKINVIPNERVLLLGAGGVAKAILVALKNKDVRQVTVANRSRERMLALTKILPISEVNWSSIEILNFDVLINATPIGMVGNQHEFPFQYHSINNLRAIMDVVVTKNKTKLISHAARLNKEYVDGSFMSFEQAVAQFELYTGTTAPRKAMYEAIVQY